MLKPVGAQCNLACDYCYYLSKLHIAQKEYGAERVLSETLLEEFTQQYLQAQTTAEVLFTWHGGEPLLRPIAFYKKALELQRRYAHGRQVDNCIQTNGTLLNDEWCQFFRDNNFLVGISIDGPRWMHDYYRHSASTSASHHSNDARNRLHTSWERVMNGIDLLRHHGVEWNAMATVNNITAQHPLEFYHFFRDIDCQFLQFTPVVERAVHRHSETLKESRAMPKAEGPEEDEPLIEERNVAPFSVSPEAWGNFLCTVYDEWVRHDVGRLFVQIFDATLANWAGEPPGVCSMSATCGHAAVMETDGSVYSCDHFVFPEYRLGNIKETPLTALVYGNQQRHFGRQKNDALTRQCRECQWLFACHGECPRNRFTTDRYGNPGHNYLCKGYQRFFSHVAYDMDYMTKELKAGRAPANIMNIYNR